MISTLDANELAAYLSRQLAALFPDGDTRDLRPVVYRALERLEVCLSPIILPGYRRGGEASFNHLHSEQYATFLYYAANTAWAEFDDTALASKIFCLNKAMNGIICMYDTILPAIFLIAHSVGTMLGKAQYANYLVVHQNVTVGTDRGVQPRLGAGVVLFGGASVIGDCTVGDDVSVSVGTTVLNTPVPTGHIVAGRPPDLTVKPAKRRLIEQYFDVPRSDVERRG